MNSDIPVKIFSGQVTHDLAEKISHLYGTELGKSSISVFKDGEFAASYEETVRGSYLFIVQSTIPPSDNLMELLLMIDAARRASAYKIIAVIPYFGFARQDRKDRARVSIGAKLVANLLMAAGVDRVMTMDLHADQIQGFFDIPVDHLYASAVFIPYIKSLNLDNLVIASPDIGGSKRANSYAKKLEADLVICHKTREKANVVGDMTLIGDVYGKNVILLDDIIDTGGTIAKAANLIKEKGAKSVRVMVSHPVLSQNAYEIIEESKIDQLIVTDSIPLKRKSSKIEVLSIADMFADVIKKVYRHQSISDKFI